MPKEPTREEKEEETKKLEVNISLGGLLGGLGDIISRLDQMTESVEDARSFEQDIHDDKGNVRGRMGVSVGNLGNFGGAARPVRRPPMPKTAKPVPREPVVDIFEEDADILVVVELPGVEDSEVEINLSGTTLKLETKGARHYAVAATLPRPAETIVSHTINNGILEIHLR